MASKSTEEDSNDTDKHNSPIDRLCDDVLSIVVSYADHRSATRSRAASRRLLRLASAPPLWRRLARRRYGCVSALVDAAPLRAFGRRCGAEADAVIVYAVAQRCALDGSAGAVAGECAVAPGGYPAWWRQVASAAARRAMSARGGQVVSIEVGNLLPEHEAIVERRRGLSKLVLVTTGCDWDGPETVGTFYACLAVLPVVDASPNGRVYLGRRKRATAYVAQVRDQFARSALDDVARSTTPWLLDGDIRSTPVLLPFPTPCAAPTPFAIDVASFLESAMARANAEIRAAE